MQQRGRKSSAKLAVVAKLPGSRPQPPADLSPEAAAIWRAEVAIMPPTWFRNSLRPLADLCRRTARLELLERAMSDLEILDPVGALHTKIWHELRAATGDETRHTGALRRQMRLTQQSQRDPKAAGVGARNAARTGTDDEDDLWNDPI